MPIQDNPVEFTYCSQLTYDSMEVKDINTIYFTSDTHNLYLGGVLYSNIYEGEVTNIDQTYSNLDNDGLYLCDGDLYYVLTINNTKTLYQLTHRHTDYLVGSDIDTTDLSSDDDRIPSSKLLTELLSGKVSTESLSEYLTESESDSKYAELNNPNDLSGASRSGGTTIKQGLSSNNFSDAYKTKIDFLFQGSSGSPTVVNADWLESNSSSSSFIRNKPTIDGQDTNNADLISTSTSKIYLNKKVDNITRSSNSHLIPLNVSRRESQDNFNIITCELELLLDTLRIKVKELYEYLNISDRESAPDDWSTNYDEYYTYDSASHQYVSNEIPDWDEAKSQGLYSKILNNDYLNFNYDGSDNSLESDASSTWCTEIKLNNNSQGSRVINGVITIEGVPEKVRAGSEYIYPDSEGVVDISNFIINEVYAQVEGISDPIVCYSNEGRVNVSSIINTVISALTSEVDNADYYKVVDANLADPVQVTTEPYEIDLGDYQVYNTIGDPVLDPEVSLTLRYVNSPDYPDYHNTNLVSSEESESVEEGQVVQVVVPKSVSSWNYDGVSEISSITYPVVIEDYSQEYTYTAEYDPSINNSPTSSNIFVNSDGVLVVPENCSFKVPAKEDYSLSTYLEDQSYVVTSTSIHNYNPNNYYENMSDLDVAPDDWSSYFSSKYYTYNYSSREYILNSESRWSVACSQEGGLYKLIKGTTITKISYGQYEVVIDRSTSSDLVKFTDGGKLLLSTSLVLVNRDDPSSVMNLTDGLIVSVDYYTRTKVNEGQDVSFYSSTKHYNHKAPTVYDEYTAVVTLLDSNDEEEDLLIKIPYDYKNSKNESMQESGVLLVNKSNEVSLEDCLINTKFNLSVPIDQNNNRPNTSDERFNMKFIISSFLNDSSYKLSKVRLYLNSEQ